MVKKEQKTHFFVRKRERKSAERPSYSFVLNPQLRWQESQRSFAYLLLSFIKLIVLLFFVFYEESSRRTREEKCKVKTKVNFRQFVAQKSADLLW